MPKALPDGGPTYPRDFTFHIEINMLTFFLNTFRLGVLLGPICIQTGTRAEGTFEGGILGKCTSVAASRRCGLLCASPVVERHHGGVTRYPFLSTP